MKNALLNALVIIGLIALVIWFLYSQGYLGKWITAAGQQAGAGAVSGAAGAIGSDFTGVTSGASTAFSTGFWSGL
jgi:ABC-type glucose/galactose transport system permease subunit